jgi:NAD dependent epimerase/dehydratase family enzyme
MVGEFANEALVSQRVLPAVLNRHGFTFQDATVESALRSTLD